MNADQVLAFRLGRSGLAARAARGLAEAAACPASDFARDAALLALAARADDVSRVAYDCAVDSGELVVAHIIRGAIHALRPADLALYGRALIARDDGELAPQLGRQVQGLAAKHGFTPSDALDEVASATEDALANRAELDKNELHEGLRQRVRSDLMPWCRGCASHHVAPMLWRYATVKAGARLDSRRRYTMAKPGRTPPASEAVRRFLGFYGPAKPGDLAEWAVLAKAPRPTTVGRGRERPRRGGHGLAPERGRGRARVAAARPGHPPDTTRRPIPAEAKPAAARPGPRAAQAPVPARGEPRSGAVGRPAGGPVAGQAKGRKAELTVEKLGRGGRARSRLAVRWSSPAAARARPAPDRPRWGCGRSREG